MNNKISEIIRNACSNRNIKRGAWADFTEIDRPVCALQAVLEAHGWQPGQPRFPMLMKILEVDEFWIHCFIMGFDRNHQIKFLKENKNGKIKETLDEISKFGISIAKEFVK